MIKPLGSSGHRCSCHSRQASLASQQIIVGLRPCAGSVGDGSRRRRMSRSATEGQRRSRTATPSPLANEGRRK